MSRRTPINANELQSPMSNQPGGIDYTEIVKAAITAQIAASQVPGIVKAEMAKGWSQLPNSEAARSPKSWFFDPLSLQYSLGYKDRRYSISFDTLKRVANSLSIIGAIINTRSAQVAAFAQPYRWTKSLGFVIRHKDPDHATTPAEIAFIKELEQFILNCGRAEKNPYSRVQRDDLEGWIRKTVRDSLVLDATCTEVVKDKYKIPYEFYAIDASTIRYSSDDKYSNINASYSQREGFIPSTPARFAGLYEGRQYGVTTADGQRVKYVQVVNGQIENVYGEDDLIYGIRNPRTDLYVNHYGFSEIEMLIRLVTAHLNAEEWNIRAFTQNSIPKGIMNFKGDNWTPEQLESFRRQWMAMVSGVENSFRTPILQSEGLEWIEMVKGNEEMGYNKWIEYLVKVSCAVFLVDPSELNFDLHGGVSQTPLFESSQEWKLKASRDRGLKPLLKFISKMLNKNIIDQIDDHFTLEFVGLDEMSEEDKHEMLVTQIASYLTLNEGRKQLDLPEIEGGDIPMNPVLLQAMQMKAEQQMQEQQMTQGGGEEEDVTAEPQQEEQEPQQPQYTELFNRSLKKSKKKK